MVHKNNHARSRQKRQKLRLKNFWNKVMQKRLAKKTLRIPGVTITGDAVKVAMPIDASFYRQGNRRDKTLNQRQRRKIKRQQPHGNY